jgi:hypothetical protein
MGLYFSDTEFQSKRLTVCNREQSCVANVNRQRISFCFTVPIFQQSTHCILRFNAQFYGFVHALCIYIGYVIGVTSFNCITTGNGLHNDLCSALNLWSPLQFDRTDGYGLSDHNEFSNALSLWSPLQFSGSIQFDRTDGYGLCDRDEFSNALSLWTPLQFSGAVQFGRTDELSIRDHDEFSSPVSLRTSL